MDDLKKIATSLASIERCLSFYLLPPTVEQFDKASFFRWANTGHAYRLFPMAPPALPPLTALIGLQEHITAVDNNTRAFLSGQPANNVLLVGARGCGKSSILRGIFKRYTRPNPPANKPTNNSAKLPLRVIETDAEGLAHAALLQPLIAQRAEKFIFFCDDLSLASNNNEKINQLKKSIEGTLASHQDNTLIYATSNRRNILKDDFSDNDINLSPHNDIQPLETLDDKIALVDRFGLRLFLQPPSITEYEKIVAFYLKKFGVKTSQEILIKSREFSDSRGSVNGRIARQFAISIANEQER